MSTPLPATSPTGPVDPSGPKYSAITGLIYVFNVIVGTGALAIPGVVEKSGYLLSSVVLVLLAFVSYITVTFVIEAMAISNAIIISQARTRRAEESNEDEEEDDDDDDPLLSSAIPTSDPQFEIEKRVEMGQMAALYFPKVGVYLFYTCLIVYLYGDLAIYITAVSKSLRDVTCTSSNTTLEDNSRGTILTCPLELSPLELYRMYTFLFITIIGPLSFFQISKTKYLQMTTTLLRWSAFILMIVLAIQKIPSNFRDNNRPPLAIPSQLPSLFGVSIYSFMCHHSLPSLVTPIKNQTQLSKLFFLDYILIATFYVLLSVTGVFAFYPNINELYTLNFINDTTEQSGTLVFLSYLLALFPVFTLTTNFPIISITLKNNLKTLFNNETESVYSNITFTLLAIIPPFIVSVFVTDIQFLVNFTGSYAGAGIQYVVPTAIIYLARNRMAGNNNSNPYASPFKHSFWIVSVSIWTVVSVSLVTTHLYY